MLRCTLAILVFRREIESQYSISMTHSIFRTFNWSIWIVLCSAFRGSFAIFIASGAQQHAPSAIEITEVLISLSKFIVDGVARLPFAPHCATFFSRLRILRGAKEFHTVRRPHRLILCLTALLFLSASLEAKISSETIFLFGLQSPILSSDRLVTLQLQSPGPSVPTVVEVLWSWAFPRADDLGQRRRRYRLFSSANSSGDHLTDT